MLPSVKFLIQIAHQWKMMSSNPFLVTFEGGEGAGKTTLIQNLTNSLTEMGYTVMITREPGGSLLGKQIRQLLLNQNDSLSIYPMAELMLFLADRAQHIEEIIKPALKAGKIVLCDRFSDSTIAYQGAARDLGLNKVHRLCKEINEDVQPLLTFFLDLDPEIGLKRVNNYRTQDRIEKEKTNFHEKVRQGFLTLAKQEPQRITVLDASRSPEDLLKEALKKIKTHL
jgi:dTMP kinase